MSRKIKLTSSSAIVATATAKAPDLSKLGTKAKQGKNSEATTKADKPKRVAGLSRDLRTIGAAAANFSELSERDEAYIREFAETYGNKPFHIRDLIGKRCKYYDGSNKLADGGVLGGRMQKAGFVKFDKAAGTVQLTATGVALGNTITKRESGKRKQA